MDKQGNYPYSVKPAGSICRKQTNFTIDAL